MDIYMLVSIAFLVVYVIVGFLVSKKLSSASDYYVMNRGASWLLIAGTYIATSISTATFIGYIGSAYHLGPLPFMIPFAFTSLMSLLLGFYFGKFLYRQKSWTIPDVLSTRYGSPRMKNTSTVISIVSMTLQLTVTLIGCAVIITQIFGVSHKVTIIALLVATGFFTLMGGMWGVVVADTIMFFLFFLAALAMSPFIMNAAGGWPDALVTAAEKIPYMFKWFGSDSTSSGILFSMEIHIMVVILMLGSPAMLSRLFIARSEKTYAKATIAASIVYPMFLFALLFVFGLIPIIAPNMEDPTIAFPWAAKNAMPPILGALGMAGVIAAGLSTAAACLQQAGAGLSHDIYRTMINPNATDKKSLFVSRISVLIIIVITFFACILQEASSWIIVYGLLFATSLWASWFPSLIIGMVWKRATEQAAFYSTIIGSIVTFSLGLARMFHWIDPWPKWLIPNGIGIVLSIGIFLLVSLQTQASEHCLQSYAIMHPHNDNDKRV